VTSGRCKKEIFSCRKLQVGSKKTTKGAFTRILTINHLPGHTKNYLQEKETSKADIYSPRNTCGIYYFEH